MRVAVVRDYAKPLAIEEWPDPVPTGEDVVVTVEAAGMCHTDLHLLKWQDRPLPLVMGHEIAGWTEELGPVLVHQSWGCGHCVVCRSGEEQLCPSVTEAGFERPGGYAEKVLVPSARHLLPLNSLPPLRAAPLTDAGATSYRAIRKARRFLTPGSRVLVIGVGALGQFAVQFLRLLTDSVILAVDVTEAKRQKALELGAHEAIAPADVEGRSRRSSTLCRSPIHLSWLRVTSKLAGSSWPSGRGRDNSCSEQGRLFRWRRS